MRRVWIRLTCNWFVIGLHCARKGHEWRTQYVGVIGIKVTACAWCGKYRGYQRTRDTLVDARTMLRIGGAA